MTTSWPKPSQLEALSPDSIRGDCRALLSDYPTEEDFTSASILLGCLPQTIKAIAKVESGAEGAFLEVSGRPPVILFEPHLFSKHTGNKYDGIVIPETDNPLGSGNHPKWSYLSYPKWKKGWYGSVSVQHKRLDSAVKLDRVAALLSASWGLFQILGENYKACGCVTIQEFINRMYKSAGEQLLLLCHFILNSKRLIKAVKERDEVTFARYYNGPLYEKNEYDTKLKVAGF